MGLNAVLIYGPGSNCQRELAVACELVGMEPNLHHISEAIADPSVIDRADFLAFPGGFTYADHAGSGVLMANQVRLHLLPAIRRHVDRSKLVFGVCNGFQMLVKAGLLPGPPYGRGAATLTFNDSGRYECRWVLVTPNLDNPGPWVQGLPIAQPIPIGHGEGKFVCPPEVLADIEANHQVAFRYCNEDGSLATAYPALPSGSLASIAGITDRTGRILGMMPHPERYALPTHAPDWTREGLQPSGTCLRIFENAACYLRSQVGAAV